MWQWDTVMQVKYTVGNMDDVYLSGWQMTDRSWRGSMGRGWDPTEDTLVGTSFTMWWLKMFAVAPAKRRQTQETTERRTGRIYDSCSVTLPALRNPQGRDVAEHHWRAETPRTKGLQWAIRNKRERERVCVGERDVEEGGWGDMTRERDRWRRKETIYTCASI